MVFDPEVATAKKTDRVVSNRDLEGQHRSTIRSDPTRLDLT
jgi:hypothetical protein